MNDRLIDEYVAAAARLQGFDLDTEQLERVRSVFRRNAEMARLVMEFDPGERAESAPQFCPPGLTA
jgi:hypothetical protein